MTRLDRYRSIRVLLIIFFFLYKYNATLQFRYRSFSFVRDFEKSTHDVDYLVDTQGSISRWPITGLAANLIFCFRSNSDR